MKPQSVLATTLLFTCLTATAFAREESTINQANPLDTTMRFHMHPPHLYLSSPNECGASLHPAVRVKRNQAQVDSTSPPTRAHPETVGRRGRSSTMAQIQGEHLFP